MYNDVMTQTETTEPTRLEPECPAGGEHWFESDWVETRFGGLTLVTYCTECHASPADVLDSFKDGEL
jgi:hypothetical protein